MGGFAIGEELREFEICYRPNSKKMHNVFLDKILGYISSKMKELDYMEYFAKTLEDEQMLLNEEKCLELYSVLEGNTKSFAMNGGETYIFKKDRHVYPELYHDDKKFAAAQGAFEKTDEFFRWWIIGRIKRNVNTAITCGLLYEIA